MTEINRAVKGTNDVLPEDSYKWQYIEKKVLDVAKMYGYNEIRVPVFEHTEVFTRSVGDTTDVVQKEMYTFLDKGERSLTLRPELTAGTVRSVIENGLLNSALPLKVCYIGGCYRYEKPQAGRLREFHQFGVECFGASSPSADAEIISLGNRILNELGVKDLSLEINSIGCKECRKKYHEALKKYFESRKEELCDTCKDRLSRNPMRILDCKSPVCKEISKSAPVMLDFLCDDCKNHFEGVKTLLEAEGIEYKINPTIVRGLDYYTRTVFEFVSGDIGAQSTVLGGGRYDGLIAEMGGQPTAGLGFGMGLERLLLVLKNQNAELPKPENTDIYFATMGEKALLLAVKLSKLLRDEGFSAETDICSRGLKAQMRFANKINAGYVAVIGDDEVASGKITVKNMSTGEETAVLTENFQDAFYEIKRKDALTKLENSVAEV